MEIEGVTCHPTDLLNLKNIYGYWLGQADFEPVMSEVGRTIAIKDRVKLPSDNMTYPHTDNTHHTQNPTSQNRFSITWYLSNNHSPADQSPW